MKYYEIRTHEYEDDGNSKTFTVRKVDERELALHEYHRMALNARTPGRVELVRVKEFIEMTISVVR